MARPGLNSYTQLMQFENSIPAANPKDRMVGAWDNFRTSVDLAVMEGTGTGYAISEFARMDRNDQIDQFIANNPEVHRDMDMFFEPVFSPEGEELRFNYKNAADWLRTYYKTDYIQTDDELLEFNKQYVDELRDKSSQMYDQATPIGKITSFLGMFTGYASDPLYFPSYIIGIGGVARTASLSAKLVQASKWGAVEIATEAGKQGMLHHWMQRINPDHNAEEAAKQIALAGLFGFGIPLAGGAAFRASSRTISRGLSKLADSLGDIDTPFANYMRLQLKDNARIIRQFHDTEPYIQAETKVEAKNKGLEEGAKPDRIKDFPPEKIDDANAEADAIFENFKDQEVSVTRLHEETGEEIAEFGTPEQMNKADNDLITADEVNIANRCKE